MNDKSIRVLPHSRFDEELKSLGINDSNVESDAGDKAFISIIGTPECLKYYLHEEDTAHWFKDDHSNVINLDFDDIEGDVVYEGHTFKAMTDEQAERLVKFIEDNLGKDFIIHCRAGVSRSQGVGAFIYDNYREHFSEEQPTMIRRWANQGVIAKLNKVLMRRAYGDDIIEDNK